ncbi:hypothetical protein KIW84_023141 [Lathyrus oleraceus]|uniref:Uncharacterized protein n=1 Tax=Pisum sativum TaxID=3888 RepID=A0A9D4YDE6_PEA|nr:hypothetical protein KIW84_023141 [Pisum sativum]
MNRVILENQNLKEERKGKAQELEDSNKRARLLEDQKDDLDHILLGSTSVIRTRKEELKKAEYRICELGRLLDKSLMDKKEIKLDFEAQIRDLRDALKKCEEKLSREILQKEEAERNCHRLRYQLEEATRRFAVLESQEGPLPTLSTSSNVMPEDGITFDARLLDVDALKSVIKYCMNGTLIKQALAVMGPETLLSLIQSNLEAEDLSVANIWLFPNSKTEFVGCNRNLKAREISSKVDDSGRSMQIDSASNDVSQPVLKARLHDFAISLLPGLDVKDIDLLFEVLELALQDVGVVQKKAYKRY